MSLVLCPLRLVFLCMMIPINFNIPVRTPKWPDPIVNFSGTLVASGREYVGDSQERAVAGGPFDR